MGTDRAAGFEALWDAHHQRVYAYALRRTDAASAEDAMSETFLVAWRRKAEMPVEVLPWLLGVARLVLANQARTRRRQEALAEVLVANTRTWSPEKDPDLSVLAALGRLRESDREALMLVSWDGLATGEAAVVAGCSAVAFRVRLVRARRRLRDVLEEVGAERPVLEVEPA